MMPVSLRSAWLIRLDDRLRDDGVLRQLGADGLRKTLLQPDELELVASGDQPQELVLRHDLGFI